MKKTRKHDAERAVMVFSLKLIGEVLAIIGVPAAAFSWFGRSMDIRLESKNPRLLAVGILAAFLVSSITLCLKAVTYREKYEVLTAVDQDQDKPPPRETDAMG